MNIPLIKSFHLANRRSDWLTLLRKAAWLLIVLVSIVYSVVASLENLTQMQDELHRWVYVYLNFGSFVLGVLAGAIIFFRKPDSWMEFATAVMLVTFTATDNGLSFWYRLFTGVPLSVGVPNDAVPFAVSLFITVPYLALLTTSLAYVLLTFPHEKLPAGRASWLFKILLVSQAVVMLGVGAICLFDIFFGMDAALVSLVYNLLDLLSKSVLLIPLAAWQFFRLRKIKDPVQRQQVRWIMSSLTFMTVVYSLGMIISGVWGIIIPVWLFILLLFFTYIFIINLVIAKLQYRLWDRIFLRNKAVLYALVTGILTVIGVAGGQLLMFFAEQYFQSESRLVGAFILVPIAALFVPVRDGMQSFIDRILKPEEVDFSSAMVEIAPDAQLMLSSPEILRILVRQCMEQLELASAAIHLRQPDGQLVLREREPSAPETEASQLVLGERVRKQLEKGQVVVPSHAARGEPYSLYVPLAIQRGARTQFLGVLAFGPRNSGEGYPTPVLKSLRKLGCDAGKAIYIAELREHLGQNITTRLAAIEKSLALLNKS